MSNLFRLCRKDEISTQNSFDIVAVFGNKVERCFDIVARVDGLTGLKWVQPGTSVDRNSVANMQPRNARASLGAYTAHALRQNLTTAQQVLR